MDRPDKVVTSPPTNVLRNEIPPKSENATWQSVERASFEKALERIRARDSALAGHEDSNGTVNLESNTYNDNEVVAFANNEATILTQSEAENIDTHLTADAIDVTRVTSDTVDDLSKLLQGSQVNDDTSLGLTLQLSGELGAAVSTAETTSGAEIANSTQSSNSSAESHRLDVERVIDMVRSLDNMPGTPSGQWTFGVEGNSTGIVALELQRALTGGWEVKVSVEKSANFDEEVCKNDLKQALLDEGHDVDSVLFTRDILAGQSGEHSARDRDFNSGNVIFERPDAGRSNG